MLRVGLIDTRLIAIATEERLAPGAVGGGLTRSPVISGLKPVRCRDAGGILVVVHRVQLILGWQEPVRLSATGVCAYIDCCTTSAGSLHSCRVRATGANSGARRTSNACSRVIAPSNRRIRSAATPRLWGHFVRQAAGDQEHKPTTWTNVTQGIRPGA